MMRLTTEEISDLLSPFSEDVHNELRGVIKSYLLMRIQGETMPKWSFSISGRILRYMIRGALTPEEYGRFFRQRSRFIDSFGKSGWGLITILHEFEFTAMFEGWTELMSKMWLEPVKRGLCWGAIVLNRRLLWIVGKSIRDCIGSDAASRWHLMSSLDDLDRVLQTRGSEDQSCEYGCIMPASDRTTGPADG